MLLQNASNVMESTLDNDADIAIMTEMWLYPRGDEVDIAGHPVNYSFPSFLRVGS